jgi:hypothetical protein
MRLYDPTSSGPQRTLYRAAAIANLDGRTMGVLENGKLNAVEMLRELAALFEAHHPARSERFTRSLTPVPPRPPAFSPRPPRKWIF